MMAHRHCALHHLHVAAPLLLVLASLLTGCASGLASRSSAPHKSADLVILVSLDGFRPDYLDRSITPNLNALAASGVRAEGMRPSFPTNTFPNHYTLVTGLRPDEHGIVDNSMRDPAMPSVTFRLGDRKVMLDPRWWDAAEPIWITVEKHGIATAALFWPGSEVAIHGMRPSRFRRFEGSMPSDERVDILLGWLDGPPADRPRFLALYLNAVDKAGHNFGPSSLKMAPAITEVDQAIGRLRAGLESRGVSADILIVSDHGMAEWKPERTIEVERIAPAGSYELVDAGATAGFDAKPGKEGILAAKLLAPHEHVHCWRKQNIPARFHYGLNARVPAFLCLADVGWTIGGGASGMHGYDNAAPEMRAIFLATGPDFREGIRLGIIDNVDVYPLIMELIGVAPRPNAGRLETFKHAINKSETQSDARKLSNRSSDTSRSDQTAP